MKNWLKEVKEGDSLFFVPRDLRWHKPESVTVTKVGRKWITLESYKGRIDKNDSGYARGVPTEYTYGSPDRVYSSEEHYNYCLRMAKLRRKITDYCASGLTDDQTEDIARLLNIGVDGEL